MNSKKGGVSIKGLLLAIPYAIMMIVVAVSIAFLLIIYVYGLYTVFDYLAGEILLNLGVRQSELQSTILALSILFLSIILTLVSIYFLFRIRYTFGSKIIFQNKDCKQSLVEEKFQYSRPKRIMFEYSLSSPKLSLKHAISGEPSEEMSKYFKSIYPDWEYKPWWKFGAKFSNFVNINNILASLDPDTKVEDIPMFQESLRMKITNLDNKKAYSTQLEPTKGWLFIHKPFYSISNNDIPDFLNGSNYSLTLKYKGSHGYSMKILIK